MSQGPSVVPLLTAFIAGFVLAVSAGSPAQAQRGPAFMNSPGYQRALVESRKQREQLRQADAIEKPSAKRPRHSKRQARSR